MKKLLFALLAMIMVGCIEKDSDGNIVINTSNLNNPKISTIIDSCEYINWGYGLAHKGNCRFCAERNKRMVREQVDSILTEIFD